MGSAGERELLECIGISSFEELLPKLPPELLHPELNLPHAKTELELTEYIERLAAKNSGTVSFLGAGAYDHFIPQTVWEIAKRGEFLTAYTPYQAEASQGTLLVLYEFQSMVCELFKMDAANASLYDGATALAEAVMLARRWFTDELSLTPKKVLLPRALNPQYKETLATYTRALGIELMEIPYDAKTGKTAAKVMEKELLDPGVFAFVVSQPNFLGVLEDPDVWANLKSKTQALMITVVNNPISLGILRPPGEWGADIAVAEGQPLGMPLSFGGPYVGLFAVKKTYLRKMPGRICGMTSDAAGKTGYTLTLQTREQHIRREKATSNICTNQSLCALAATIYLSLLGPEGLKEAAELTFSTAHELRERLKLAGAGTPVFEHEEFFQEFPFKPALPIERIEALAQESGVLAGYALGRRFAELPGSLLIAATEKTTVEAQELLARLLKGESIYAKKSTP